MEIQKPITKMSFSIEELAKSSRNSDSQQSIYNPHHIELSFQPVNEQQRKRKRSTASDDSSIISFDSNNSDDDSPIPKKKNRTIFTNSQLVQLEMYYSSNKYLQIEDRPVLSKRLKLSQTQIKWWFQNRRMKEKRQIKNGDQCGTLDMSKFVGVGRRPVLDLTTQPLPGYSSFHQHPPVFNPFMYGYKPPFAFPGYTDFYSSALVSPLFQSFAADQKTP